MAINKAAKKLRIKRGIRNKISGTAERPRLSVYRSNTAIYAQLIDDRNGQTLTSASSTEIGKFKNINIERSKEAGKKLAEKAVAHGIKEVVFDRNGHIYHGRIKAFAEGAREGGLKF
jgi:large subunit ribosomal protein L18